MKTPFGIEMQIVRRRMQTSLQNVASEFGLSRQGVLNIMRRNKDLVEQAKQQLREEAIDGIVRDATSLIEQEAKHGENG